MIRQPGRTLSAFVGVMLTVSSPVPNGGAVIPGDSRVTPPPTMFPPPLPLISARLIKSTISLLMARTSVSPEPPRQIAAGRYLSTSPSRVSTPDSARDDIIRAHDNCLHRIIRAGIPGRIHHAGLGV